MTYYALHTTHYYLRTTTYYALLTTHYTLRTTYFALHTTHYILRTTHYALHTTHCLLGDFLALEKSQIAKLDRCQLAMLRMYTSSSYPCFNRWVKPDD